jgi:hypothetical protein
MKHENVPLRNVNVRPTEHRGCRNPAHCQRREDRVEGFADPRARDSLLRWCTLCKKLVVTGRI